MSSAIHLLRRKEADAAGKGGERTAILTPIPILPYKLLRWDRDAAPAFPLAKRPRVRGIQSGAQRFSQYNTMLDFGTPPVLGSPTLQCLTRSRGTSRTKS